MTQLALFPTVTRPPLPPLELDPPGETGIRRNGKPTTAGRYYAYQPFTAVTHAAAVVDIVSAMQEAGHVGNDWWETAAVGEFEHPARGGAVYCVTVVCEVEP